MQVQELSIDERFILFQQATSSDYGFLQDILTWGVDNLIVHMDEAKIPHRFYYFDFKQRRDGTYQVF